MRDEVTNAKGKRLLAEIADIIRKVAQDNHDNDGYEFLLNLAAVVENMNPEPLRD